MLIMNFAVRLLGYVAIKKRKEKKSSVSNKCDIVIQITLVLSSVERWTRPPFALE